jgi:sialate O-acetylesterase
VQLEPDGARVLFDHADDGLVGDMPVAGFEVAGQDRRFHAASATIDGSAVLVRSPDVRQPVAVRYAWSDAPKPWLRNKAGLPASPFRTDEWPGVTEQGSWKTDGP